MLLPTPLQATSGTSALTYLKLGRLMVPVDFKNLDFTPGVTYEFSTGWVDPERRGAPENTAHTASDRKPTRSVGYQQEALDRALVQRIEGKGAKLGLLDANQGGVVLNLAQPGEAPVWSYNVYTGYDGYADSQVLPYFAVEMRSLTRRHAPELNSDPPPSRRPPGA